MSAKIISEIQSSRNGRASYLIPIIVIWGMTAAAFVGVVTVETGLSDQLRSYYLVPWAFLTCAVVLSPSAYLLYKGKFDPFHPLVFAAWSYIFPAFVLGALFISFGWVSPYFLAFIDDPQYNLPLSLIYVMIGFAGLTVGYALPVGGYAARKIEKILPSWDWKLSEVPVSGMLLLFAGMAISILGFVQGIIGYQRIVEIGVFDGLIFSLLVMATEGNTLIWLSFFGSKKRTIAVWTAVFISIISVPIRMALYGSRSSLLLSLFPIAMAFRYSGRRLKMWHAPVFAVLLAIAIAIGMIYGTTFRNLKTYEANSTPEDYLNTVGITLDYLSRENFDALFSNGTEYLLGRVENLSSLGVVVANYEKLAPYEAAYGLENNILNDAWTAFIPRFLWPEKPVVADTSAYSELYFNYGENSFAITPFGDLLRNFGPIGIPLGMALLGIYLRVIYSSLIATDSPAIWKKVVFVPLLTNISYEGFYSAIFPSIIRSGFVLLASLVAVNLIIKASRSLRAPRSI
jgi:hypothetical protein